MPTNIVIPLVLGLTLAAVVLAGVCYGVKEGVARLIGGGECPLPFVPPQGVGQILCDILKITVTVGGICGKNSPLERDAAGAPLKKAVFSFCCLIAKGA